MNIGEMSHGVRNNICDVSGVSVGHCTVDNETHKTGVTVVMPCFDNPFTNKLVATSYVLNGFGKTLGLIQIDELGSLETPIALTNTLNVGLVHDALVEYTLQRCKSENVRVTSVNPVVCECNDAALNDISDRCVKCEHVFRAIESASADFKQGDVGCGKGTTCHGLKGGVGSASRVFDIGGETFTLGVLMQTNHGRLRDLIINGERVGESIYQSIHDSEPEKGSCIAVIATDLPVTSRQLKRIIKRAGVGLARLGSFWGHGSGDVFVGFSTANRISVDSRDIYPTRALREERLDAAFRACAEAVEESVLNSMLHANGVTGFRGNTRESLSEYI